MGTISTAVSPTYSGQIARFFTEVPIKQQIREAITSAVDVAVSPVLTTNVHGHASYQAFSHGIQNLTTALKPYGFEREDDTNNQARLIALTTYQYPVRIRIARAQFEGNQIVFSGRKGPETAKGFVQNSQHFNQQSLFRSIPPSSTTPREWNLHIIYQFDKHFLSVWAVTGTKLRRGGCAADYSEREELFSEKIGVNTKPKFGAPQDSSRDSNINDDYGISFGVRNE